MKNNILSIGIGVALGLAVSIVAVNNREPMLVVATTMDTYEANVTEEPISTIREITEGERDLLAGIVFAEAKGEDLEGKRYVVDVVLNRVDSEKFPNDIVGVIFQKNQFWTRGLPKTFDEIPAECYEAVDLELEEQLNTEILYFRNKRYHSFGTPVLNHGGHYFSK